MTKIELALILKIIDTHTSSYTPGYYGASECHHITNVKALKADIQKHYEEVLKTD